MDKLLLRIFVGLVAVVSALGLFTYGVLKISNQVRLEHHWSDVATPAINYFVSQKDAELHLQVPGLVVLPYAHDQYSDAFNARIDAGQTVFSNEAGRYKAWAELSEDKLLELDSDPSGTAIYQLYLTILQQAFSAVSSEEESKVITQELGRSLDVGFKYLDDSESVTQAALEGLAENGQYLSIEKDRSRAYLRSGSGQVIQVDLPDAFTSYSWLIIALLMAFATASLTLACYLLVKSFDYRLRNIETVAGRIARGELDARVKRVEEDDSISRLGSAFNAMADHIQRLMYVQKEMIHAVSHELRTPVARIRFGVQMIEDSPSEEALRKQIAGIDGDIQELDELIDEILTYARLEQGGPILAFQEADVAAIVEQVVSEQGSVKPDMNIYSIYSEGSDLWKLSEVEARYIHRSIQNLVGNATRYASGKVKVVCSFDQETCRVDVEDDGPGIPEDQWESVFTPFARLDDSRTRSSGGYGLGLSIVRRILYWHGGQAFLGRSAELGGAKFSLVWPRRQPEENN